MDKDEREKEIAELLKAAQRAIWTDIETTKHFLQRAIDMLKQERGYLER